jgi:hypothetical protein
LLEGIAKKGEVIKTERGMYARPTDTTGNGAASVETWKAACKGDGGIMRGLASLSRARSHPPGNNGYVETGTRETGHFNVSTLFTISEDSHYPRYLSG